MGFLDGGAILIVADGTNHQALVAELSRVISEIGGCTTQALPCGEFISKDFTNTYYESFV